LVVLPIKYFVGQILVLLFTHWHFYSDFIYLYPLLCTPIITNFLTCSSSSSSGNTNIYFKVWQFALKGPYVPWTQRKLHWKKNARQSCPLSASTGPSKLIQLPKFIIIPYSHIPYTHIYIIYKLKSHGSKHSLMSSYHNKIISYACLAPCQTFKTFPSSKTSIFIKIFFQKKFSLPPCNHFNLFVLHFHCHDHQTPTCT